MGYFLTHGGTVAVAGEDQPAGVNYWVGERLNEQVFICPVEQFAANEVYYCPLNGPAPLPEITGTMSAVEKNYDVFFSYSHEDAALVEYIAIRVEKKANLRVWLDKWISVPGEPFRKALEKGIDEAKTCAVFIGSKTPRGWAEEELNKAINKQTSDHSFRVIPVLLPDGDIKHLNGFLESRTWVDFKKGIKDAHAMNRLICGITGTPPGKPTPTRKPDKVKSDKDEKVDIIINIQGEFEGYTSEKSNAVMDAIRTILKSGQTITIKQITKGSIKITLELKRSEAERLKEAIEKGELAHLNVTGAVITAVGTAKPGDSSRKDDEMTPDQKTLAALRKGDTKAVEYIYKEYLPLVVNMVRVYGGTRQDAIDVYQDVLITLLRRVQDEQFKLVPIKAYIYAACRNLWLERVSRLRKSHSPSQEVENYLPQLAIEPEEEILTSKNPDLEEAIDALGVSCRNLLTGYYVEGKTLKQLAEQFGYSSANEVKVKKFRCMLKLREILKKRLDNDNPDGNK